MSHYQFTSFNTPTPEPELEFDSRPMTSSPSLSYRRDYATAKFQGRPMLYRIYPELGRLCCLQDEVKDSSRLLLENGEGRGQRYLEQLKELQLHCHRAARIHEENNLMEQLTKWELPTEIPDLWAIAEEEQRRVCSALKEELKVLEERAAHVRQVLGRSARRT
ncbi:unnamed protein product [Auanema sp. JU1783]|nr:unnamed protein product [Auanema sp. JU1783]